jgi:TolA-binding protein
MRPQDLPRVMDELDRLTNPDRYPERRPAGRTRDDLIQAALYALDLAKLAQRQIDQVNDQADQIRELRLRVRSLEKANEWLRRQVDRLRDPSHRAAIIERLKHNRRDVEQWEAELETPDDGGPSADHR